MEICIYVWGMRKLKSVSGFSSIVIAVLYLLMIIGYLMCVYKFVTCDFSNKTSYKAEVIYGVGTFTGLGCIVGWIDLGE